MQEPPPLQQVDRTCVRWGKRKLIYFGGCDYFRLASHPDIVRAAARGAKDYGLSVSASRLTTGNHPLYVELEAEIARFFGTETAVLTPTGYLSGLIAAQALKGTFSHALIDSRAHSALLEAAGLLECPMVRFGSRDPHDLEAAARRCGRESRMLVMTDGLFSHDGSVAPLREYLRVLPRSAMLLVDDSHAAGVLGASGRGTAEHAGVDPGRMIQTITLSKAFGAYGGAILGGKHLRRAILERSRCFGGSTPLPLPLANAALAAVKHVSRHGAALRRRLFENVRRVRGSVAAGVGLEDTPGPIIGLIPAGPSRALALKKRLLRAGIHPPFIRYAGGPASGYFRFAISSEHTAAQLDLLAGVLF